MDNKITKTRLSNFLAYEWILIIIVAVIAIVGWELIYTMTGVRLTVGQTFKIYYDESVMSSNDSAFYDLYKFGTKDSIFSYDVIEVNTESLTSDYNVLSVRLSTYEGDIIISDTAKGDEEGATSRAEYALKNFRMYDMDGLCEDAKKYLSSFLKNGETDPLKYENLDQAKITSSFKQRMKKDNRFRGDENMKNGIEQEKARIKKLCEEVAYFDNFLQYGSSDLFYKYTLNEQVGEKRYGLNAEFFNGTADPYFRNRTDGTKKGIVILAFNFREYQPDLQYETISFLNMCVREFTNFIVQ